MSCRLLLHARACPVRDTARSAVLPRSGDELAKLEKQIEQLEVRLENQELSAADVQHMAKEKAMLKESIARVETQRAAAQEALWEVEMAVTKEMDTVCRACARCAVTGRQCSLPPCGSLRRRS